MAKRGGSVGALVAVAVLVWGVAGVFAWRRYAPNAELGPAKAATKDGSSTAHGSTAPTAALAGATATPSGSAPAAASSGPSTAAKATAAIPADTNACVIALFPAGTFKGPADFGFVCGEANAMRGGLAIKARLINGAGGKITDAMRQWAGLEWYEMGAFSFVRARCCSAPAKLHWRFKPACPFEEALADFEAAIRTRDDARLKSALEEYTRTVRCLNKLGQAKNFGRKVTPGAGLTLLSALLTSNGHLQ